MQRHELSDEEWAIIEPLLPNKPRGVPRVDDRRVINGILWQFRTGAPWRDAPERYGPRTTLCNRFVLWPGCGCLGSSPRGGLGGPRRRHCDDRQLLPAGAPARRRRQKGGADAGDGCMGRSRGGLTIKTHALVDADGRPIRLDLTPGQAGDAPAAGSLLENLAPVATLIADRACDANAIRNAQPKAAHGPTSRRARSARAASPSRPGSIAGETSSSASSTPSSNSAAWPHDTTGTPRTTSPPSSSPPSASGLQPYESAL